MKKTGIIFDCDGTLVDSLAQSLVSFNFALKEVTGREYSTSEIKRFFGSSADRIFFGILQNEKQSQAAFEIYLRHQTELAPQVRLHEGIAELLQILAGNDVPLAVVTGRHALDLEIILRPHQLNKYFITMIADNHLPKSKPAPDGILLAAKRMNLAPQNTFYVGDSMMDIQAARHAGAKSIAALWDQLANAELMEAEKPTSLARYPREVWEIYQATA